VRLKDTRRPRGTEVSRGEGFSTRDGNGGGYVARALGFVGRRATGWVLVVCAVISVLVALDYWSNAGTVYRGVEVAGISLGGKTPEEARTTLEERASGTAEELQLTGPGGGLTLNKEEMGFHLDVAASVEKAYAVGRRGGITERLGERMRAAFGQVGMPPEVEYDAEAVRLAVEDHAKTVSEEPQSASVAVVGGEVEVEGARRGFRIDVPETMENVEEAVENLSGEAAMAGQVLKPGISTRDAEAAAEKARTTVSGPVVLASEGQEWTLTPEELGETLTFVPEGGEVRVGLNEERLRAALADVYAALTVEPVEADYEVNGGEVVTTESRSGRKVEEGKLFDALEGGLFEGKREYEAPVAVDHPELTTAEAERLKPTELLGSYRTDYTLSSDKSPERVENLEISSGAVSGTVLAPGEVFSMNEKLAPLDYNATKVIINGKETKADGGGLCQVTSTLYMAANYAGLDVIERNAHYAQLPYIRPGLDATVWFGDASGNGELDMEFENTTEGYVLLREYVAEDGYVYAEVWGRPNGTEVKTWSEPVYRNADSAKWVTYQTVKKDGEVLYDGVLHKDTYGALADEKGKPIPADLVPIAPVNP
jgi:vancomycin resistance protein YoaR